MPPWSGVSDFFGGQDPFQAPCSCSRLSGEDLAEQGSDGFVFSAPGGLWRLTLSLSPSPGTGDTSWHCCGVIFVWAGGIFLFLLMVCCGQPRLLSDLTGVCYHSYFSPECFPVFASAVQGETKVTVPSDQCGSFLISWLFAVTTRTFPSLFALQKSHFCSQNTDYTSTEKPSKQTTDRTELWISLCFTLESAGIWLTVLPKLGISWLGPAGKSHFTGISLILANPQPPCAREGRGGGQGWLLAVQGSSESSTSALVGHKRKMTDYKEH